MKRDGKLEEQLYFAGLIALAVGAVGLWLFFRLLYPRVKGIGCVFRHVTGFYCPGCGGTRAVLALLQGHFLHSLWYHPLVLYAVVMYSGFMLSHTLARLRLSAVKGWRFHNWYLYVAAGIVLINWILKNVLQYCFRITM